MRTLLPVVLLTGCDPLGGDDTGTDTGAPADPLAVHLEAYCVDSLCVEVGLLAVTNRDEDISTYSWVTDVTDFTNPVDEAIHLNMVNRDATFYETTVEVTDVYGQTAQASAAVANLTQVHDKSTETTIEAIVVTPTGIACAQMTSIAGIGGCLTQGGLLGLKLDAWRGLPPVQAGNILGTTDFDLTNGGTMLQPGFINHAAWYVPASGAGTTGFYPSSSNYTSIGFDPLVAEPTTQLPVSNPTEHVTFWFLPEKTGTTLAVTHVFGPGNFMLDSLVTYTCTSGVWSPVIMPAK